MGLANSLLQQYPIHALVKSIGQQEHYYRPWRDPKDTLLGQARRTRSLRHKHPLANQTLRTTGDSTRLPITIPRKLESSIRTSSSPTPSISAASRLAAKPPASR